ncbi:maltase A3-like [Bemisia tabaci]|uniref:maltase A3-like n=1 Tax=Bemisia tabaci TaxID=7038 RepID=UPI003B281D84
MVLEFFLHPDGLIKFFGDSTDKTSLLPFYFRLMWMDNSWRATDLNHTIHGFMDILPANGVPSWMASTHDFPRIATRVEPEFSEAASMIQLMLPGLASIYYGQEIGMTDVRIRADQRQEDNGRDGCRGPMQWDESLNSGFTTNKKAWLPVNPEYWRHNVKEQLKDPLSHLNIFKRLLELRHNPVIKNGELETCVISEWMFLFA